MSISHTTATLQELRGLYENFKAMGSPILQSNAMLVPQVSGYSHLGMLVQSHTRAMSSNLEPAEVNLPMGLQTKVNGVAKTKHESQITFYMPETNDLEDFSQFLMANGGSCSFRAYIGSEFRFTSYQVWEDCCLTFDNGGDFSADGRSQIATVSATASFMYFGGYDIGNVENTALGKIEVAGMKSIGKIQGIFGINQQIASLFGV